MSAKHDDHHPAFTQPQGDGPRGFHGEDFAYAPTEPMPLAAHAWEPTLPMPLTHFEPTMPAPLPRR